MFGAAKNCKQAKAVVGLDPWFYPHSKDTIGAADHQKLLIVMTEKFPGAVKTAKGSNEMDTYEQIRRYGENSKHQPVYKELKDLMHFN